MKVQCPLSNAGQTRQYTSLLQNTYRPSTNQQHEILISTQEIPSVIKAVLTSGGGAAQKASAMEGVLFYRSLDRHPHLGG